MRDTSNMPNILLNPGTFSSNELERIIIPDPIKTIGDQAFAQNNLLDIVFTEAAVYWLIFILAQQSFQRFYSEFSYFDRSVCFFAK